jgi:hypothetical protein
MHTAGSRNQQLCMIGPNLLHVGNVHVCQSNQPDLKYYLTDEDTCAHQPQGITDVPAIVMDKQT